MHNGTGDSSVLYIPVCGLTEMNAKYALAQRERFENGTPGPDFPGGEGESRHVGRPTKDSMPVGEDARRAMGLEKLVVLEENASKGEREMVDRANVILGFA